MHTPNDLAVESIIVARADLLTNELGTDETVMLDIDRGAYFGVEGVAKTIWDFVQEPRSVREVCAQVSSVHDTDGHDVEADAMSFLQQLRSAGLVTIVE